MNKSKFQLFLKLGNFKNNKTRIVCVDEFIDDYQTLKLGNGGSWCRFDCKNSKKYKIITCSNNLVVRYSWIVSDIERYKTLLEIGLYLKNKYIKKKGRKIFLIKIQGIQNNIFKRPIGLKVRTFFKNKPCVVCGSNNDLVIDHKNGLYNNQRVLDIKTQKINDFQVLCNHCNLQKRQTIVWSKKFNKRYPATKIPQLKYFNIDFIKGCDKLDLSNPNAMIGTYWYDPILFLKTIFKK